MRALAGLVLLLTFSALSQAPAGSGAARDRHSIAEILGFETVGVGAPATSQMPAGWSGGPPGTLAIDTKVVHTGRQAARLQRSATSPSTFSTLTTAIPLDCIGMTIELRGFLRTDAVAQFAGLWLREDSDSGAVVAFDNMQRQAVSGTRDWTEYRISLPLQPEATRLVFGVLLSGPGTVWADDLDLLVDGQPIASAAPARPRPVTALDRDREFEHGSRVAIEQVSSLQTDNLVTLGRVWGFLKYHHPRITAGQRNWDYELFRVLPRVLAARSRSAANTVLAQWVDSLGEVKPCRPCAHLRSDDLALAPDIGWIHDTPALGEPLRTRLETVYQNRSAGTQFYVTLHPGVGNPSFDHELVLNSASLPDPGVQLLALFRFWNIVQYWSPNREIAGENWPEVLRTSIPRVALARDRAAYETAMLALVAAMHDTHTKLRGSLAILPPVGECRLPVNVRFLDAQAVVSGFASDTGEASGLRRGDVLQDIDGQSVASLVRTWTPLYAASNEAARLRDVAQSLTNGACGPVRVVVERAGTHETLTASRQPAGGMPRISYTHDLPGPAFRLLSPDVAYLKLSSVKAAEVPGQIERARGAKGLIVDIRNYPSEFVVFALGNLLVRSPTPFVQFTAADLGNPGAFRWGATQALEPALPHYSGKVVVLVDETTQSSAEYTAMALRAAPDTVVVGNTTAGADGNVSAIPLPGGLSTAISGLGVFYPDRRPTQRVGIVPDVQVKPTQRDIAAGRDEVLETAIRQILGRAASDEAIHTLVPAAEP